MSEEKLKCCEDCHVLEMSQKGDVILPQGMYKSTFDVCSKVRSKVRSKGTFDVVP